MATVSVRLGEITVGMQGSSKLGFVWRDGVAHFCRPAWIFWGVVQPFPYSVVKDRGSISFYLFP